MTFFYRSILLLVGLIGLVAIVIGLTEVPIGAQIPPPDVGLVIQLSGDATYWNEGYRKTPEKAQAFMQVRQGDHFRAAAGATVQLVYFQNGRKETWKGPAAFVVGEAQSRAEGEKGLQAQPEVMFLTVGASQGMNRLPALLRRAGLSRSGGMQIRGVGGGPPKVIASGEEERTQIARAKETYQNLRKQARPEDITPELNLLGILADYDQFEEMEKVIQDALKIQPANEVLKELAEWVRTQRSKPTPRK
jgi:hypothetical protein